jgi:hypothetical protein
VGNGAFSNADRLGKIAPGAKSASKTRVNALMAHAVRRCHAILPTLRGYDAVRLVARIADRAAAFNMWDTVHAIRNPGVLHFAIGRALLVVHQG